MPAWRRDLLLRRNKSQVKLHGTADASATMPGRNRFARRKPQATLASLALGEPAASASIVGVGPASASVAIAAAENATAKPSSTGDAAATNHKPGLQIDPDAALRMRIVSPVALATAVPGLPRVSVPANRFGTRWNRSRKKAITITDLYAAGAAPTTAPPDEEKLHPAMAPAAQVSVSRRIQREKESREEKERERDSPVYRHAGLRTRRSRTRSIRGGVC